MCRSDLRCLPKKTLPYSRASVIKSLGISLIQIRLLRVLVVGSFVRSFDQPVNQLLKGSPQTTPGEQPSESASAPTGLSCGAPAPVGPRVGAPAPARPRCGAPAPAGVGTLLLQVWGPCYCRALVWGSCSYRCGAPSPAGLRCGAPTPAGVGPLLLQGSGVAPPLRRAMLL